MVVESKWNREQCSGKHLKFVIYELQWKRVYIKELSGEDFSDQKTVTSRTLQDE